MKRVFLQFDATAAHPVELLHDESGGSLYDHVAASYGLALDQFQLVSKRGGQLLKKTTASVQHGDTFLVCPFVLGGKVSKSKYFPAAAF